MIRRQWNGREEKTLVFKRIVAHKDVLCFEVNDLLFNVISI